VTIVIDVTYPFGYVHATPWGTHVNEGVVEWPPSPWRLLRGLAATWYARCHDLDGEVVRRVLASLAGPPAVRAAPRCEASIRSYLPDEAHRSGAASPSTDLVVDAFAAVAPGTGVSYRWDVELDDDARATLDRLVDRLPYLGRAESICEAAVRQETDDPDGWVLPKPDGSGTGRRTMVARLPFDLDALCVSISSMRGMGQLRPAGAEWIRYDVAPPVPSASRIERRPTAADVHVARFALSGRAPVSVRRTLVVAEKMRSAAMSQFGRMGNGEASPAFVGRDPKGQMLKGNRHAHWLPIDADDDGLLETLVVWVPGAIGANEVAALDAIRHLEFHGGDGMGSVRRLSVALEWVGQNLGEVGPCGAVGPSRSWRSVTPFLPQRHRKQETLEAHLVDCIGRELRARGTDVQFDLTVERATSWGSFRRHRSGERLASARPGFGVRLRFDGEVDGPICIGQLSHFGMGRSRSTNNVARE